MSSIGHSRLRSLSSVLVLELRYLSPFTFIVVGMDQSCSEWICSSLIWSLLLFSIPSYKEVRIKKSPKNFRIFPETWCVQTAIRYHPGSTEHGSSSGHYTCYAMTGEEYVHLDDDKTPVNISFAELERTKMLCIIMFTRLDWKKCNFNVCYSEFSNYLYIYSAFVSQYHYRVNMYHIQ